MLLGEVDLLKVGRRSLWAVEELNKRLGLGIVLMWRFIEEELCLELKVFRFSVFCLDCFVF